MSLEVVFDVAIIGGGPAGMSAALMLGRACREVVLLDQGKPRNAAARQLHGFLSRDGIAPVELLRAARQELSPYGVQIVADEVLATVACPHQGCGGACKSRFSISTRGGRTFTARKLLFATGICDTLPEIPGMSECYGATVHHCPYCDGWEHRGKRLLALGQKPAKVVELGVTLRTWSSHVTVLTNGELASEEDALRLKRLGVAIKELPVVRLVHEADQLNGVLLEDGTVLTADALFFSGGHTGCELPRQLGCEMDRNRVGRTDEKQKTNLPGVFMAGDADADVQFAIVAAAEGAIAATVIDRELREEDEASFADSAATYA